MGRVKDLMIEYAEIMQIDFNDIGRGVSLAEMQRVVNTKNTVVALPKESVTYPTQQSTTSSLTPGLSKADCSPVKHPPIPWVTLGSYIETGLKAVGIKHYAIAIVGGEYLTVTYINHLLQVCALKSRLGGEPTTVFQVKLFLAEGGVNSQPLAAEFKKEYTDVAVVCAEMLSGLKVRQAVAQMEADWAQQDAADNADADAADRDLCERGEALAEQWAQLGYDELSPL